jgi:hypothetical protein
MLFADMIKQVHPPKLSINEDALVLQDETTEDNNYEIFVRYVSRDKIRTKIMRMTYEKAMAGGHGIAVSFDHIKSGTGADTIDMSNSDLIDMIGSITLELGFREVTIDPDLEQLVISW